MDRQTYGIIGHPVEHSFSPAMHNAAFKALGMDAEYLLYDVAPDGLEHFLDGASGAGISGLNVTIPHKVKTKEYLERKGLIDETARRLGAVNTLKAEPGSRLKGFNTDGPGFYRSLVEDLRFEPEGKTIFVLGAGGAARAVVMYLGSGPKKIFVSDADEVKALELKDHYGRYYDGKRIEAVKFDRIGEYLKESGLLVNATPVGMRQSDPSPVDKKFLHPGLFIYDLVYNRPATWLVRDSQSLKLHGTTGLGMLLYQGVIAFEIWTGIKAPVGVMKKALREAIRKVDTGARGD